MLSPQKDTKEEKHKVRSGRCPDVKLPSSPRKYALLVHCGVYQPEKLTGAFYWGFILGA